MQRVKVWLGLFLLILSLGLTGCSSSSGSSSGGGSSTDPLVGTWTGTGYEPITTINIKADHTGNFVGGQSFTWQLSGDHLYLVLDTSKDNEDFLFKWTDPNTKTDFTMVSHYGAGDLGRFHKSNAKMPTRK
jgi:hypothetical protein